MFSLVLLFFGGTAEARTNYWIEQYLKYDPGYYREERKTYIPKVSKNPEPLNLIIAPHPDDEILCCGKTIRELLKNQERVKIVYVTNGDGLENVSQKVAKNYGQIRRRESILAARSLGLKSLDLFFLDFPDRHLSYLKNKSVTTSIFTDKNSSGPNAYNPGTLYTQESLRKNLTKIIQKTSPRVVYFPDPETDTHFDHKAVGRTMDLVLQDFPSVEIKKYKIHGAKSGLSQVFDLQKLQLIRFFKSQYHDEKHADFLENFARIKEHFE